MIAANPLPIPTAMDRYELDRQFDQLRMSALFGDGQAVALQTQPDLRAGPVVTDLDDGLDDDASPDEIVRHERRARRPEPRHLPGNRRHGQPRHMTALLVDDEPVERQACKRMLEHAGYDVLEAAGMPEARATLARRGPVDVMISDVQKAMDGEWSL